MTNPTSNYGFVLPTSTDLVTDLPADFEVALQGVDTRLKALQPGTTLGDIAYSSATANTNTRLPIGTSGQVLAVSGGGVPAWTTTADVTPLTTKGDLFTFTTVDARIGVGANNTVLTADSSTATGLKWATPASGMTLISTTSFSGATTANIDNIFSSTYTSYKIILSRWNTSGNTLLMKLRYGSNTQSTNYYGSAKGINSNNTDQTTLSSAATAFGAGFDNQTGSGVLEMLITDVGTSAIQPMFQGIWNSHGNYLQLTGGQINANFQTYTGLQFLSASGNVSGTISVYGLAK